MKPKFISKLSALVLTSCLVLGGSTFGNVKSVEAVSDKLTIKASDFNAGTSVISKKDAPNTFEVSADYGFPKVELILDEDIHLDRLSCYGYITVSGSHKLCMDMGNAPDIVVCGDFTLSEDSVLYLNNEEAGVIVKRNSATGGNAYFYGDVNIDSAYEISADEKIIFSGSDVSIKNSDYLINDVRDAIIKDTSITASELNNSLLCDVRNLTIENSSIDVKKVTKSDAIRAKYGAIITGSTINVDEADHIFINVEGGNINVTDSFLTSENVGADFINIFNGTTTLDNTLVKVGTVGDRFIYSHGDIALVNSSISVKNANHGINTYGKIVSDSDISIDTIWGALSVGDSVYISAGQVNLSSTKSLVIESNGLNFTGGNLSVKAAEDYFALMIDDQGITIGDECYIATPVNGEVGLYSKKYSILGEDGLPSSEVELCEYKDLSKAEITGIEDKTYTGQPITQSPVVTVNGKKLVEGTDYIVSYTNNTEVGTATITFSPVEGSYCKGKATATFNITEEKKDDDKDDDKGDDKKDDKKYSSEWVDGKWYNADGTQDYAGTLSWKQNENGWWVEDTTGWYAKNEWQKIDGKWYYFLADGYMDYSEYRDGCWLGADGAWDEAYSGGHWMSDATGWWYTDASGWYPQSKWLWIDGSCYYFGADGYMATSTYVDGCWVGADGAWVK